MSGNLSYRTWGGFEESHAKCTISHDNLLIYSVNGFKSVDNRLLRFRNPVYV